MSAAALSNHHLTKVAMHRLTSLAGFGRGPLTVLLIVGLVAGGSTSCDDVVTTQAPNGEGEFLLTIGRSTSSQLSPLADSALIVVRGSASLNVAVEVPDPGMTTTVPITVPAATGYTVGVISYFNATGVREPLEFDRAEEISVGAGEATIVELSPAPLSGLIVAPDTLIAGDTVQISASLPEEFLPGTVAMTLAELRWALNPWTDFSGNTEIVGVTVTENVLSAAFPVPAVPQDTTVWLQFVYLVNAPVPDVFLGTTPSLTLGESLIELPVKASGTITVVFDKEGRPRPDEP